MTLKKNYAISILDFDRISDINSIILKHAEITIRSSSYLIFDKHPVNVNEVPHDITIFQLEAKNEKDMNEKLDILIENLNKVDTDYALRDQDTGKMLVYVKFVGVLDIRFDKLEIIKKGTYKKIDEMKDFKTEFGICKGYKPHFRPVEGQPLENITITPENIYIYCHTQEDLLKMKDMLTEKIMELDSDFEIDFRQFSEDDLY